MTDAIEVNSTSKPISLLKRVWNVVVAKFEDLYFRSTSNTEFVRSSKYDYIIRELTLAGYIKEDSSLPDGGMGYPIVTNILELSKVFYNQRHSGFSASIVTNLFTQLMQYKPLTPLTGEPSEWRKAWSAGDGFKEDVYQNLRLSSVFKEGIDGQPYDISAVIYEDENGARYTVSGERYYIQFPYVQEVKIVKEGVEQ